jgi:F-type H+-transporting ATPase subunit a
MSGTMLVAILLAIIPFVFPIIMQAFGMLTGFIQAYIFAVLAMVYIASATSVQEKKIEQVDAGKDKKDLKE